MHVEVVREEPSPPPIKKVVLELSDEEAIEVLGTLGRVIAGKSFGVYSELFNALLDGEVVGGDRYRKLTRAGDNITFSER